MSESRPPTALRTFEDDIELLSSVLDDVCRAAGAEKVLGLRNQAVELARRAREGEYAAGDELEALIAGLDLDTVELLIRAITRWFELVNLAEDNERVRRIQARTARETPQPRRGSIADAVDRLAQARTTNQEIEALLDTAEIRLVMTAHPTEARRRTTIDKQARVFRELRALDDELGRDEEAARRRIRATVQELWGSDPLRATGLTVLDEVRGGLVHFNATLTEAVPVIYRELEDALAAHYPDLDIEIPSLLRFGSWIGGDRDGNPFVTAEMTLAALDLLRDQCLRFLETRVELLAGRLSLSERVGGPIPELKPLLDHNRELFPELAQQLDELNPEEPYRRVLTLTRERIRATARDAEGGYGDPAQLLADLRTVEQVLIADAGAYTAAGDLRDVIRQVEVFGFHFAKLDIRQHAAVHRAALDELFGSLGVATGYASLPNEDRERLLVEHIEDRRPLIPADISRFSDQTRETIEMLRVVRQALAGRHRGALDAYVISGTESAVDLLEVLLLMKETSLADAGGEHAVLRIVPLFEAGATLDAAPETLARLLRIAAYRNALRAVGDEQEVMIGYSDSNKDVGYLASGWSAYRAQSRIADLLRENGISWIFFHGRGGAVGRGGGPTNAAIRSLPPGTVEGRLKMTEQGEVLNAKFTVAEIAHRELELTTSATLLASRNRQRAGEFDDDLSLYQRVMEEMSERSSSIYRAVVHDDPDFVEFFLAVTPVDVVSSLRLGSRPARRRSSGGIDQLRAIPWVFSWTQARIVLPAWLGLGTALRDARERHGVEVLREMLERWPFFDALLSNAEMACAKADPGIAARYIALWDREEPRERIWGLLGEELELTRAELIRIRGGERLLDTQPVLQVSIGRRNPSVDPLSFIQIELLRRRRAGQGDQERIERLGLLAINGIASGLRNTG